MFPAENKAGLGNTVGLNPTSEDYGKSKGTALNKAFSEKKLDGKGVFFPFCSGHDLIICEKCSLQLSKQDD